MPHLSDTAKILDCGCGPGTITADFAKMASGPGGAVIGVDSAPGIVEKASKSFPSRDHPNLGFQVASIYTLPFEESVFDIVHAHQVLQHLADPVRALREMRRVCKDGGIDAVRDADYAGFTWAPGDTRLDSWMTQYQRITRSNGGDPNAGRNLLAYARQAGFVDIIPSASVWCFATDADRQWWGSMWAERVKNSAFSDQMRETGVPDNEIEEMSRAFADWTVNPAGWFTVPHGELICKA